MLDYEEVFGESSTTVVKVMLALEYDKHQIFKVALVSQLNANVLLSKDRFTHVKISIFFKNNNDYISASSLPTPMLVRLGSNLGIFLYPTRISSTLDLPRNVA